MSDNKSSSISESKTERPHGRRGESGEASRLQDEAFAAGSAPMATGRQAGRAQGRFMERGAEALGEATRRSAEAGADTLQQAGAAAGRTTRRGAQVLADSQREFAETAARRV